MTCTIRISSCSTSRASKRATTTRSTSARRAMRTVACRTPTATGRVRCAAGNTRSVSPGSQDTLRSNAAWVPN
eukprot:423924-Heterocapsa_arctica.AAC.1